MKTRWLTSTRQATGIEVKLDLFADGDELFTKLKAGNPGYDVIIPPNDKVERMSKANMLMALDHSKIPNIANIDPAFMNPSFDPGRKWSLPYMWGTVGIGYRKSKVEGAQSKAGPRSSQTKRTQAALPCWATRNTPWATPLSSSASPTTPPTWMS